MTTLARVSAADFENFHCGQSVPVIVSGASDRIAAREWTPQSLCAAAGARVFRTAVTQGDWFGYDETGAVFEFRDFTLAEALDRMETDLAKKYYVLQIPFAQYFPDIIDQAAPPVTLPREPRETNIWVSGAEDVTPVHFDPYDGLLVQVYGSKAVTVFPPDQNDKLYPLSVNSPHGHVSQVKLAAPDHQRFPLFAGASCFSDVLHAGEMLFLPAFWWHGLTTLSLSVSLNYWWIAPPSQFFVPIVRTRLAAMYDRSRLRNLRLNEQELIALARWSLDAERLGWCAVLYAAAAFEYAARSRLPATGRDGQSLPGRLDLMAKAVMLIEPALTNYLGGAAGWPELVKQARSGSDIGLPMLAVGSMIESIEEVLVRLP